MTFCEKTLIVHTIDNQVFPGGHRTSLKVHIFPCVMGKGITRSHIQIGCGHNLLFADLVSSPPLSCIDKPHNQSPTFCSFYLSLREKKVTKSELSTKIVQEDFLLSHSPNPQTPLDSIKP